MEPHKYVPLAVVCAGLYSTSVQTIGHGVVDVQQGDGIAGQRYTYQFAECAVHINLTGHGDPLSRQAAVHIAGYKAKLCLKGRPAFPCNGHDFVAVLVHPVQQRQFILSQLAQ